MTYGSTGDQNYGCCGVSTVVGAVATSFAFLFVLIVLFLYARYLLQQRRRRRQLTSITYELGGNVGLNPEVIAALPSFAYQSNSSGAEETPAECSVCLSVLEEGEIVRLLPNCKHWFHQECIDLWLNTNATCPVCRANVEPKAEADESLTVNVEKEGSSSVWLGRMVQRDNGIEDLERQ